MSSENIVSVLGHKLLTVYDAAIAIYNISHTSKLHPPSRTAACFSDEELPGFPTNNLVAEQQFSIFRRLAGTAKFRNKGCITEEGNNAGSE